MLSNLYSQIKEIKKKLAAKKFDARVRFFNSHQEYEEAAYMGEIGDNEVCIIEDVPEED